MTRAKLPDRNHRARGRNFLGKENSRITKYSFSFSPTNRTQSIRRNLKKPLNRKTRMRGQKNHSYLIQSFYDFIIIFVVINAASHNVLDSFILKTRTSILKTFSSFLTTLLQIILFSNHFHKARDSKSIFYNNQPY